MPISRSSSLDGSSSTMIAMFRISFAEPRGIDRSASATSFSNAARSTASAFSGLRTAFRFALAVCGAASAFAVALARDQQR